MHTDNFLSVLMRKIYQLCYREISFAEPRHDSQKLPYSSAAKLRAGARHHFSHWLKVIRDVTGTLASVLNIKVIPLVK